MLFEKCSICQRLVQLLEDEKSHCFAALSLSKAVISECTGFYPTHLNAQSFEVLLLHDSSLRPDESP